MREKCVGLHKLGSGYKKYLLAFDSHYCWLITTETKILGLPGYQRHLQANRLLRGFVIKRKHFLTGNHKHKHREFVKRY